MIPLRWVFVISAVALVLAVAALQTTVEELARLFKGLR